ncbi:uncharacterized protein LOC132586462 [Heteronotia binoei]|uniref:uncharacterized protein LOC132586462 n=1 Tax=Heteronotia binoei TaxID=13085 RepID=UPI002931E567|nr:uncharacterized protein LOC132586462 [Heteronotia binoei]
MVCEFKGNNLLWFVAKLEIPNYLTMCEDSCFCVWLVLAVPNHASPFTLQAHGLSTSEPDLWRNGLLSKFGSFAWRKQKSSHLEFPVHPGSPKNYPRPLGRLHRPAVGSDSDMRRRYDFCPSASHAAGQERPELSFQTSKIDSVSTRPLPSASFNSLLCWGNGNSWDSIVSNSSLHDLTSPQLKDDAFKLLLAQEKTSSTLESLSEWTESEFEGHLSPQASCPIGTGELENLSLRSSLGESISGDISETEGSRTTTSSLDGKWPPKVGGDDISAFKTSQAETAPKILYEILITLTKEEEDSIVGAMPSAHCSKKGLECHSSREETLSPGVAELEKTEDQRHRQEPAQPAPQLSKLKEFQNCTEPHGVGTFKACRLILSPATGRQVTPQWGSEPSPGQRKDQSATDQLHSGDGETAEGTGTVAPVSWADSFSELHEIPPGANSQEIQPDKLRSIGQRNMEKVSGGSRFFQGRAGGSITSSSFSWKKAAADPPREEVKPPLSKASAMAQMIEKGTPRASSPSRVSVLLEAWEKGLVGMEPAAQPSSTSTRRSRSPIPSNPFLQPI